jgi:replicative DNA helicase
VSEPVLKSVEQLMGYNPDQTIGIPFGIEKLDEKTTGMRAGQVIVVGGFPKSGKTSFAIDVTRKAVKNGFKVGFFSREMLKEELIERMFCQETDVTYEKIRKPMNMSISEFRVLQRAKTEMDQWPLWIDDNATHISEIIPRAHLMIRQKGVELIVLDYLQIVDAPGEKEYERVSTVANMLTSLAKTTKVPILALSQLTHPEGKKGDMNIIPNMGMLRSSGQIAQNAHLILFTYHPYDTQTAQPTGEDFIIVGAQRAGPTGRVTAFFNLAQQRWEERGIPERQAEQQQIFERGTT